MKHLKKRDKKTLYVVGGAVVGALIVAYGIWSFVFWNGYGTSAAMWRDAVKKDTDAALALPMASDAERSKKREAFDNVVRRITTEADRSCAVNALLAWQGVFPSLAERNSLCRGKADAIKVFAAKLAAVSAYEKAGKELGDGFAPLVKAGTLSEKTWSSKSKAWQQHLTTLKAQKVSGDFVAVHKVAVEKEQAVVDAWKVLLSSHAAKNVSKFADAKGKLNSAYGNLSEIGATSATQFKALSKELQSAYDTAF
jgi:hypothetical protein